MGSLPHVPPGSAYAVIPTALISSHEPLNSGWKWKLETSEAGKLHMALLLWRWTGLVGRSAGLEEAEIASNAAGRDLRSTATENSILPVSE